jgi:hypothetical protein
MSDWDNDLVYASCPGCGVDIAFWSDGKITVNCHNRRDVKVPGLWVTESGCKNPMCEWSKVKIS